MPSWSRVLRRLLPTLAFVTVLAVPPALAAAPSQVLSIGNGAEPKDLNPHVVTGVPETHIIQALFEGLVGKDPKTLEPTPGVAEKWTLSKDGKTYTFFLRKDAKWSNGEPVTAQDFVYSWTRLLEPKTAAEYAYQGYYFKNGKDFSTGKLKDASKLGFKAKDATTLEVQLENATPFFLALLFHHSLYPVPRAAIEKFGQRWTRPENMVTNGAFQLARWDMNQMITVKPNPHYWDAARVKLSEVNFLPIEKADTEEKMFQTKKVQITDTIPLEKITTWQKKGAGVYQQHPYLGVYHYWFNTQKAPFDNKLVRRAFALAIDRDAIVKFVTKGGQLPAVAYVPPGTGGYQPAPKLPADGSKVKEAQALLAKAGFPGGKGFPVVELLYNTSDAHKKVAEALQQMWKKNLGVDIKLLNQEWKVYLDTQRTMNFQISRQGWIGDYNDPNTFLDMFMSDNGNNRSGWKNKTYDTLIDQAGRELDAKKRLVLFGKAEALLLEELPCLPIYYYTRVYLKDPAVQGWFNNIEDVHPLKYVSMGK